MPGTLPRGRQPSPSGAAPLATQSFHFYPKNRAHPALPTSGSGPATGGPMAWGCQHRGGSGGTPRAPLAAALLPRFKPERRLRRCDALQRSTSPMGCEVRDGWGWPQDLPWVVLCPSRMCTASLHSLLLATACPQGWRAARRRLPPGTRLRPEPTPTTHFRVTPQEGGILPANRPRPVVIETLRGGEEAW